MVEHAAHNGIDVGSNPTKPKKLFSMKFTSKEYKITKTKNYLKNNAIFFFFSGINQDSGNWIKTEQGLKNLNFNYCKVFNKTSTKTFYNSIYKNITPTINSVTFFINPNSDNSLSSKKMLLNIETFVFLAIKINNKIYSFNQLKYLNSFDYCDNKLLLYQFCITNIKISF